VGSRRAQPPSKEGAETAHRPDRLEARGSVTSSERLSPASRLGKADDYQRVFERGRRRRLPHLDLVWAVNEAGYPRLGLIVPKFQSTAVARNRLRRRLKEIWRRQVQGRLGGLDLVIRARREAYRAGFDELRDELVEWVARQQSGAG